MEYILNKDIGGKQVTLRQFQIVLLDMIKDINQILEKNEINYILFSETALGAVCNQGFMPWGDELNVAIMRDDYSKLLKVLANDLPSKYIFQCFDVDQSYLALYPAIKIRLQDTYVEEKNVFLKNKCESSSGIFINIFILNYISEYIKADRKWRLKNLLLSIPITIMENLDINPIFLKKTFINNAIEYGNINKNSLLIGEEITQIYKNINVPHVYLKSDIFPAKKVPFEGILLPIPNNPDELLIQFYGADYMNLILEKDGVPNHIEYVSLSSACKDRNKQHFPCQNLILLCALVALILVIFALLIFDEASFLMFGWAIILFGIVLIFLINKKS